MYVRSDLKRYQHPEGLSAFCEALHSCQPHRITSYNVCYTKLLRAAVKDKVKALVASGQLGPFANAYWGHAAMKLPPEANLMAVSHYLEALDYQRKATQALAIISGKNPHIQNLSYNFV